MINMKHLKKYNEAFGLGLKNSKDLTELVKRRDELKKELDSINKEIDDIRNANFKTLEEIVKEELTFVSDYYKQDINISSGEYPKVIITHTIKPEDDIEEYIELLREAITRIRGYGRFVINMHVFWYGFVSLGSLKSKTLKSDHIDIFKKESTDFVINQLHKKSEYSTGVDDLKIHIKISE